MLDTDKQRDHYDRLMADRRPTRGLSCGFDSRFDPFLLDRRPDLAAEFEHLFSEALEKRPAHLLDMGCGSGLYFPVLAGKAERITGVDISSEMVKASQHLLDAKGINTISVRTGSAEELPFEDESFDAVLGFDVLHHIPDVERALSEVRRVLRPGGRFVSIEPNVLNPIVWFAHALPPEERGALRHNYPWAIKRLVTKHIGLPRSRYVNHVTAPNSAVVLAGIRLLGALTSVWPLRYFSIRMVWSAEKR